MEAYGLCQLYTDGGQQRNVSSQPQVKRIKHIVGLILQQLRMTRLIIHERNKRKTEKSMH